MKRIIRYYRGEIQFAPMWYYKLPKFLLASYQGDNKFKFLGRVFLVPNSVGGDTLFMAWKRDRDAVKCDAGEGL